VCDRVGVIRAGRLVAEGTVDELRARTREWLRIQAQPLDKARQLLADDSRVERIEIIDESLKVEMNQDDVPAINRALVEAGIEVHDLHWERASLEEVFFELTREQDQPNGAFNHTQDESKGETA
jgi:ABC-2 type transport system ATP-binding protein